MHWAMYHKNVSILLDDEFVDFQYATSYFEGENSEPLLCRLENGFFFHPPDC
jgi:hypothetical protein